MYNELPQRAVHCERGSAHGLECSEGSININDDYDHVQSGGTWPPFSPIPLSLSIYSFHQTFTSISFVSVNQTGHQEFKSNYEMRFMLLNISWSGQEKLKKYFVLKEHETTF